VIKILADTSALVSLEIKHLVAISSKVIQFCISDAVHLELKEIAEFDDVHGRSAKDVLRLIDNGIIAIRYVSSRKEYLEKIDIGEAEILTLSAFSRRSLEFNKRDICIEGLVWWRT
jgi:hypothetical protein